MSEIRKIQYGPPQGELRTGQLKQPGRLEEGLTQAEAAGNGRDEIGIRTADGRELTLSAQALELEGQAAGPGVGDRILLEHEGQSLAGIVAFVDQEDQPIHIAAPGAAPTGKVQGTISAKDTAEPQHPILQNVTASGSAGRAQLDYRLGGSAVSLTSQGTLQSVAGGLKYKKDLKIPVASSLRPTISIQGSAVVGRNFATDAPIAQVSAGPRFSLALTKDTTLHTTPEISGNLASETPLDPRVTTGISIKLD